jgi:hypothetical protein
MPERRFARYFRIPGRGNGNPLERNPGRKKDPGRRKKSPGGGGHGLTTGLAPNRSSIGRSIESVTGNDAGIELPEQPVHPHPG